MAQGKELEPSRRVKAKRLLEPAINLVILASAIYGIYKGVEELKDRFDGNSSTSNQPQRLENLKDLRWEAGFGLEESPYGVEFEYSQITQRYFDARNQFIKFSDYELGQDRSPFPKEFVERERIALVVDGASIINNLVDPNLIKIDQEAKQLEMRDIKFDLSDLIQLFIADQMINQTIIANDSNGTEEAELIANQNIDDLIWLFHSDLPIVFENNVFGYPPDYTLIELSRYYQKIIALGYPLPYEIRFKRYAEKDPGAAWYIPGIGPVITEIAGKGTIGHEELHHQADMNPTSSQAHFNNVVADIKARIQGSIKEEYKEEDMYVNPDVLDNDKVEDVAKEDYAETLKTYFYDGIAFRRFLKSLYLQQNPACEIVQAKYDFAQEFYNGDEFLKDGEVFNPQPGDIFRIDDPDITGAGISLRPTSTFEKNPEFPTVWDKTAVLVLDGPEQVVHLGINRMVKMYRVQRVLIYDPNDPSKYFPSDEIGWMWAIWFGDRVTTVNINEDISEQLP